MALCQLVAGVPGPARCAHLLASMPCPARASEAQRARARSATLRRGVAGAAAALRGRAHIQHGRHCVRARCGPAPGAGPCRAPARRCADGGACVGAPRSLAARCDQSVPRMRAWGTLGRSKCCAGCMVVNCRVYLTNNITRLCFDNRAKLCLQALHVLDMLKSTGAHPDTIMYTNLITGAHARPGGRLQALVPGARGRPSACICARRLLIANCLRVSRCRRGCTIARLHAQRPSRSHTAGRSGAQRGGAGHAARQGGQSQGARVTAPRARAQPAPRRATPTRRSDCTRSCARAACRPRPRSTRR